MKTEPVPSDLSPVKRPPVPPKPSAKHEDLHKTTKIPTVKPVSPPKPVDDLTASLIRQSRIPMAKSPSLAKEESFENDSFRKSNTPSPPQKSGSEPIQISRIPMASPTFSTKENKTVVDPIKQSRIPTATSENLDNDPIKQSRIPTAKSVKPELPSKPKVPTKPTHIGGQSLDAIKQSRLPAAKQVEIKVTS